MKASLTQPDTFVATLLARYAANKDILTRYQEHINAISAEKVRSFLEALSDGGGIEYLVP